MVRLTEEMVIARSRTSDIGTIRKLNCWGVDLTDVSLLRRMANVEVLSLSVNKITSLADFQYCKNLKELYVRKNEIKNLNEVWYLKDLPCLRHLWLGENPCAKTDWYRMAVLKALPNLEKLDDVVVQPEEVQDALRKGLDLVHPEDCDDSVPQAASYCPPPQLYHPAVPPPPVSRSPPNRKASCPQVIPDDIQVVGEVKYQPISDHPSTRNKVDALHEPPMRRPSKLYDLYCEPVNNSTSPSENGGIGVSGETLCGKCSSPLRGSAEGSPVEHTNTTNVTNSVAPSPSHEHLGNGDRLSPERECELTPENCDRYYRQWWHDMESEVMNPSRIPRVKSYPKNAEVLFSILSLMNHVDYPGLALLSVAVRRRMQEFEN